MGFRFPLSAVLRFRESLEKREELALQITQLEIARVGRRIDELAAKIARNQQSLESAMQSPLEAYHLQLMLSEVHATVEERANLLLTLEVLQQKREEQLNSYRIAHSGRQMLTDIFTQQRNAHEQKQLRTQQKLLDDIFAARSQQN
jgi:flagellar export protein FliJ